MGDKFFDHFNLVTLESSDFYPDGRDLGENYTLSSWLLSPCLASNEMDCIQCHTSSGRFKFAKGDANAACLPCHQDVVKNAALHSHHPADSTGNKCISCHMPMTAHARMQRSDHSMRAPSPAATLVYKSPNACNECHKDKDANWADKFVRQWYPKDYQASLLAEAALIDAARKRDWSKLPQMLAYIENREHNAIFTTGLIRLLAACPDSQKFPVMRGALADPSPLVRSAAVDILAERMDASTAKYVATFAKDPSYLVRIRVGSALSPVPLETFDEATRVNVEGAEKEYLNSLTIRQDDYAQHLNLGNYHHNRQELPQAVSEYEKAAALRSGFAPPLVNASVVYSQMGDSQKAEDALQRAIASEPDNAAAHFNMGLLLAEKGQESEAEKELRKTPPVGTNKCGGGIQPGGIDWAEG